METDTTKLEANNPPDVVFIMYDGEQTAYAVLKIKQCVALIKFLGEVSGPEPLSAEQVAVVKMTLRSF